MACVLWKGHKEHCDKEHCDQEHCDKKKIQKKTCSRQQLGNLDTLVGTTDTTGAVADLQIKQTY